MCTAVRVWCVCMCVCVCEARCVPSSLRVQSDEGVLRSRTSSSLTAAPVESIAAFWESLAREFALEDKMSPKLDSFLCLPDDDTPGFGFLTIARTLDQRDDAKLVAPSRLFSAGCFGSDGAGGSFAVEEEEAAAAEEASRTRRALTDLGERKAVGMEESLPETATKRSLWLSFMPADMIV